MANCSGRWGWGSGNKESDKTRHQRVSRIVVASCLVLF